MKTGAASNSVVTLPRRLSKGAAFSLLEVIIALVLVMLMCVSVFPGLQLVSRTAMNMGIRSEAHRLLQEEAERLIAADSLSFAASADETITSCIKTTYSPGTQAKFDYPPTNSKGRVTFTRRVVAAGTTPSGRTLRVEVRWTWQGKADLISATLYRTL